jgi:pimeloyl-ACP methyl ester carboxylesterase
MTTLVLLPGLLCDEAVWQPQSLSLSGPTIGAQCIVPDYGTLDSIGTMADVVLASVKAPSFSLAGHSMGGRVALEIVRRAPQRVERLALLDTGVDPIPPGAAGADERTRRLALLDLARERGMRAMGREWAPGMVHPDRVGTPLFDAVLDMIERKTPQIHAAQINALLGRPDGRDVLRGVRCDTLLLCGRQDAWSPLARHEQMHALLPDSRLVVVEQCGHMSTMEQPEAVSAALRDWLQRPVRQ